MDSQHAPNALAASSQLDLQLAGLSLQISRSESVSDVKGVRNKAEAARSYARNARLGLEMQNKAAEIRLRAERRVGELLSQMKLRGGDRKTEKQDNCLKLDELGITQNQSTRWQRVARIDDDQFHRILSDLKSTGQEITFARLIRVWQQDQKPKSRSTDTEKPARRCVEASQRGQPLSHLEELSQHRRLLASILTSVIRSKTGPLRPSERKHVAYLLMEIERILDELKRSLT